MSYRSRHVYRESHQRWKRKYRETRRFHPLNREKRRCYFTGEEDHLILSHHLTDTETAKILKTSVDSVQTRRCRLKKIRKPLS